MYATIIQKTGPTATVKNKQVSTPIGFGPFESKNEGIGAAIEYLRTCGYVDSFYFDDYGDSGENARVEILNKTTGNKNLVAYVIDLS